MIAVVATMSSYFSSPVIIPTSLFAVDPIARGTAAGNITAASSSPMPSTAKSAGTASRNGGAAIPIIPASTGTQNPSSEIAKARIGETGSAACRIL